MIGWIPLTVTTAILGTALIGGIFFAFSTFIMKALGRVPAPEGIRAMQTINIVVLNPLFLGVFFGTGTLSIILLILVVIDGSNSLLSHWFLVGALNYVVGTFLVTILGNVPLNNQLAIISPDEASGHDFWQTYLRRWTLLNHIRTTAALLAAFCFIAGLIQY